MPSGCLLTNCLLSSRILLDLPARSSPGPAYQEVFERCHDVIEQLWEMTRPILCRSDADGLDVEEGAADDVTATSAAWRAMRDAGSVTCLPSTYPKADASELQRPALYASQSGDVKQRAANSRSQCIRPGKAV